MRKIILSSIIVTEQEESATLVVCDVKCWGTIYYFQLELQDKIYMHHKEELG